VQKSCISAPRTRAAGQLPGQRGPGATLKPGLLPSSRCSQQFQGQPGQCRKMPLSPEETRDTVRPCG